MSGAPAALKVQAVLHQGRGSTARRLTIASSYAWAELVICKQGNPTAAQRVASELKTAGWQRMLSDNGNEFRGSEFPNTLQKLAARHSRIHAGGPQTNGHLETPHKTILDKCWRPAFARYIHPRYIGLKEGSSPTSASTTPTVSTTAGSHKDASPQTSSTALERWRPSHSCRHILEAASSGLKCRRAPRCPPT
jgi:transposase InsO family protein